MTKHLIKLSFYSLLIFCILGCGVKHTHWVKIESMMANGEYAEANKYIEESKKKEYGKRNAVLYYFDKATVLHHLGEYEESGKFLEKAELKIDDLYTKSLTTAAGSYITNPNLIPYDGEDFEEALVNMINALNYIYRNDLEGALVEGRKVDHKLQMFSDRYADENKKAEKKEDKVKIAYTEDAFIRYLMANLFEDQKEYNDSFLFYRKALNAYEKYEELYGTPMFPFLKQDLLRMSEFLGFTEHFNKYKSMWPDITWTHERDRKNLGELIFIHLNGFSPYKKEYSIQAFIIDNYMKVALPEFIARPPEIKWAELKIASASPPLIIEENEEMILPTNENEQQEANEQVTEVRQYEPKEFIPQYGTRTYLSENITEIAVRNLKDRFPSILRKAIARLIVKETIKAGAQIAAGGGVGRKKNLVGHLVGFAGSIYTAATERADLRSWRLLPAEISIAKIDLKPGFYAVAADFKDSYGHTVFTKYFDHIEVKKGRKTFFSYRTY